MGWFFFYFGGVGWQGMGCVWFCLAFSVKKKKSPIMPTHVSEKTDLNGAGCGLCSFPVGGERLPMFLMLSSSQNENMNKLYQAFINTRLF